MQNPHKLESLSEYLSSIDENLKTGLQLVAIGSGHSNPTFAIFKNDKPLPYVLRKQPDGPILKSAHAIDREFRIMSALKDTAVPVPKMINYCQDTEIIGTPFYLMEKLDGVVFHDNALEEVEKNHRAKIFDMMNETLANLHSLNVDELKLGDYGPREGFINRQILRWKKQHELSKINNSENIDRLSNWLENNKPDEDENLSIIHGDYRLGNIMFSRDLTKIIAVLDWELSTIGNPMSDIGYNLLAWVQNVNEYNGLGDRDLEKLGIPKKEEYIASYLKRRNIKEEFNPFFIALSFFRLAVIFEGIIKRAEESGKINQIEQENHKRLTMAFANHGLKIAGV